MLQAECIRRSQKNIKIIIMKSSRELETHTKFIVLISVMDATKEMMASQKRYQTQQLGQVCKMFWPLFKLAYKSCQPISWDRMSYGRSDFLFNEVVCGLVNSSMLKFTEIY